MKYSIIAAVFLLVAAGATAQQKETQNDYGLEQANTKFIPSLGTLGGRTDYDYLSLKDHPDVSGVPLGGVGAGNVNLSPSGRFTRIGINNIHMPIKRSQACFFSIWTKQGGETRAVRLVREQGTQYGMQGVAHTNYRGLLPTAELKFEGSGLPVEPVIRAWSGLVPHNVKESSLPVVWFEVDLTSPKDAEVSVALSWEDFIGLFNDPLSTEGMDGQVLAQGRAGLVNGEQWPLAPKAHTLVGPCRSGEWQGFVQYAPGPLTPNRYTLQNYNDHVAVIARRGAGEQVSILPCFDVADGGRGWADFAESGSFGSLKQPEELSAAGSPARASALAIKTTLKAGKTKTLRFALVWFCPRIEIDPQTVSGDRYWKHGADYDKYFHNYFNNIDELVDYAARNGERIKKESTSWHAPIMASTLPDWYKFKLINSGYVIYTNMALNRKGDVMVNEGAMGGLGGTMDQRLSAHPFYQKFFTQLDRSEMDIFADAMDPDGYILHFIGHYYVGMGTVGGKVPTEKGHMLDNSSGWIIQLVKDYQQTGDGQYLRTHLDGVKRAMAYLRQCMPEGSQVPVGKTTYDDFTHPPLYSYYAGVWLATLKAYEEIGKAVGDREIVEYSQQQFAVSQKEIIAKLWNGRFFAYGCEPDGSKRLDCVLFTGQLAGQFLSRYCGWGDVYPMDMVKASLVSQFKISLSKTSDYYANKVWDINLGRGIDNKGSQCWPFYLESYTGLTAMQAGFYDDAMDILKHIQLVHLRHGWTWTQNLWNPADITYMTAPVTWFSTDVLAGAGLNVPQKELRLAPIVANNSKVVLPLFYPTFWATLTADPTTRKLNLEVTRTFPGEPVVIERIISQPAGESAAEGTSTVIAPFTVTTGKALDLSAHWDKIVDHPVLEKAILPDADNIQFRFVTK